MTYQSSGGSSSCTGAFKSRSSDENRGVGGADVSSDFDGLNFKASYSNAIYGKSSTVQPPALLLMAQIKF